LPAASLPPTAHPRQAWFFVEIFYALSTTFTKLAAGTLLLRVTTKRVQIRIIYFIMIFTSLFGVAFVVQIISQCTPVSFFWSATRNSEQGHCESSHIVLGFTYAQAVVSSIGDWTFGILPAFIVKDLDVNARAKWSVFLILCLANIGSVATLIRIKVIHQISASDDFVYATVDLAMWSSVEVGMAILAVSMATYRVLFRSFYSNGTTRGSQRSANSRPSVQQHGQPPMRTAPHIDLRQVSKDPRPETDFSPTSATAIMRRASYARGHSWGTISHYESSSDDQSTAATREADRTLMHVRCSGEMV
jgi:hypothetical protein